MKKITISDIEKFYQGDCTWLLQQIERQREVLKNPEITKEFVPYTDFVPIEDIDPSLGHELIAKNKIGVLILAGGVGSRLRFEKPKGCFPIYQGKSLYEIAVERIKKAGHDIQIAIMTSELTDKDSREFFESHNFFGLPASQVDFFCQKSWPLLDFEGNLFLQSPGTLAMGPNGNGEAISLFAHSSIFKKWQQLGIEHLSLFPIDNPLAEPCHPSFIAHHVKSEADVSIAVARKRSPEEKMGVVAFYKNKLVVVEYTELTEEQKGIFIYGNLAIMLFSMAFIQRVKNNLLPIHAVKKATKKFIDKEGIVFPREPNAYKFEQFIFDLLEYSERSEAVIFDRASSFAPLKELEGPDGVKSVQQALLARGVL